MTSVMTPSRAAETIRALPPADELLEYAKVSHDAPMRLLGLIEEEVRFRRALVQEVTNIEAAERKRGQVLGFAIGSMGIVAAAVIAMYLKDWPGAIGGSALGGSTIVGLVYVFVTGRAKTSDRESAESPDSIAQANSPAPS